MTLHKYLFEPNSKKNYVLMNPSYSLEVQNKIKNCLLNIPIEGHVWIGTSGTTQSLTTKWVALSLTAILSSAVAVNKHLESNMNDIWIHSLPNFHVGGIGIWARAGLSGAKVVDYKLLNDKWDSNKFHEVVLKENGTCTALVPAQLFDLVKNKLKAPKSLRACIIGGGALNETLYIQARELGWCPLPSYGLSECASQVATASLESLMQSSIPKLKLLSHITQVSLNNEKKFRIKSDSLLSYYAFIGDSEFSYHDPKIEGWFQTEDIMKIEDFFLKPLGRLDDFIKIGGESVNLTHLNDLLEKIKLSISFKGDAALFPFPDDRLGYVIHLALSEEVEGSHSKKLIAKYHTNTLPFEKIRKIHYLKKIPRTELKKLKKNALLDLVT